MFFQVVHNPGTITFDLLSARDRAKDNLCKALCEKWAETNATNDALFRDDGHGSVVAIKHESRDVLFRHLRQLCRENVFRADERNHVLGLAVVPDYAKLDFALHVADLGAILAGVGLQVPAVQHGRHWRGGRRCRGCGGSRR